jgi:RimJ/RimL family protein N-acetyltransferase
MVERVPVTNVETARLRGEPVGPQHLDLLAPVFADPRVGRTMGGVMSRETVAEMCAHAAEQWERDGFAYWVFRRMCKPEDNGA